MWDSGCVFQCGHADKFTCYFSEKAQHRESNKHNLLSTLTHSWTACYQSCYFACETLDLLIPCCFFYSSAAPAGVFVFARSPLHCRFSFCFFFVNTINCVKEAWKLIQITICAFHFDVGFVDECRCEGRWGLYVLELIGLTWKLICQIRPQLRARAHCFCWYRMENKNTTKTFITIPQSEVINYWAEGSGPEAGPHMP